MKDVLLSPAGAWALAALTTLLAALESSVLPWAPFLLLYGLALPFIPLSLGSYLLGSPAEVFRSHAVFILALSAAMLAWEIGLAGLFYERKVLGRFGKTGSPYFSPTAALNDLVRRVPRPGFSPAFVKAAYGLYFLAWAPVAEEFFFWGYLYPVLQGAYGIAISAIATSAFFGFRHGLHFFFLLRFRPSSPFPWPAATALVFSTFVTGLMNSWLYANVQSLWPLILLHFLANFLWTTL